MSIDTRSKILTEAEALDLPPGLRSGSTVVLGFFDPLLADHVRRLKQIKPPGAVLIAVILDPPASLLGVRARAELTAAIGIIDFVVPVPGDVSGFLRKLQPGTVIHDADEDQLRTARLIEHVQRRYQPV